MPLVQIVEGSLDISWGVPSMTRLGPLPHLGGQALRLLKMKISHVESVGGHIIMHLIAWMTHILRGKVRLSGV